MSKDVKIAEKDPAPESLSKLNGARGSYLRFALKNPESNAADKLGLKNHELSEDQISDILTREKKSQKASSGFLTSIMDFFAAIFESLTSGDFGGIGQKRAERKAMRSATALYESLVAPGADGLASPYADLASKISGVQPDGNGGYQPVLDDKGKYTGQYGHSMGTAGDPQNATLAEARDRGLMPSEAQNNKNKSIYDEESKKLYARDDIKALIAKAAPEDPSKPHANSEAKDFVMGKGDNDKTMQQAIEKIADRMISESDSLGNFNLAANRDQIIGTIKRKLIEDHQKHKTEAAETEANSAPKSAHIENKLQHADHNSIVPPAVFNANAASQEIS